MMKLSTKMDKIHQIPEEILLKVFSFLSQYDKFYSIPLVSKHFLKISKDSKLAKSLSFKYVNKFVFEDVKKLLDRSKWLEEISFDYCLELTGKILCYALRTNQKLISIKIGENEIFDPFSSTTALSKNRPGKIKLNNCEFQEYWKNIERLAICNVDQSFDKIKLKEILGLNLKSLKFDGIFAMNINGEPKGDKYLNIITRNCKYLEEFYIDELYYLSTESLKSFFTSKSHTLKALTIKNIFPNHRDKVRNIDCLQNLEELTLIGELPKELLKSITKIPKLKRLHINDSFRSFAINKRMELLAQELNVDHLEDLKILFHLYFDEMNYGYIVDRFHPKLKRLELGEGTCHITQNQIVRLIKNCPNLKCLVLNFGEFRNLSDEILARIIYSFGIQIETKDWMKKRINKYLKVLEQFGCPMEF